MEKEGKKRCRKKKGTDACFLFALRSRRKKGGKKGGEKGKKMTGES